MFSHGLDYGLMSILSVELFIPMSERNLTSGPFKNRTHFYPVQSLSEGL